MSIFQKIAISAILYLLGMAIVQTASAYNADANTTTEIRGLILSDDTNEPIIGAHVRLQNFNLVTTTDESGEFFFVIDSEETRFSLRITHIGYRPEYRSVQIPDFYDDPVIRLIPVSEMMSPLTVISNRPLNSPSSQMDAIQGTFLPVDSGAFLKNAGNASGIRRGGFGIDPVIRGLSGSRLNIRVDGLATTAAACPNRMDPPTSHIRLSDIERVEIHRGPHALQYGPSFGGTVNFIRQQPEEYTSFGFNGDFRAGIETNTGHQKTDMRIMGGTSKWDFMVTGGYSSTDDYTSGGGESVKAGFNSFDIGAELGYRLTDSQRIHGGWSQSIIRDADFPALGMDMAMDDTYKAKAGYKWTPLNPVSIRSVEVNGYWSLVDHEMNNHNRPDMFAMRDAVALAETETYGVHSKVNGLLNSGTWTVAAGLDH
ncbi:MAG: TonB-dependent receptor plug domain-containing protein, partial [Balneolaceae bacterium]|nr:TonB-dependent receptor plug domain-containing protein [Balneolaceae bacterium]